MKLFLKYAFTKTTILMALKAALVVGTILALINHYDAIFNLIIPRQLAARLPFSVS